MIVEPREGGYSCSSLGPGVEEAPIPASLRRAPPVAMQTLSPLDDAALQQIRKTAAPPRVSVLDVIKAITRLSASGCSMIWNRLHERHPEVITSMHKFPGARQKHTHVADAKSICEIVMLLPGKAAADFRKRTAEVLVRYLGGDEALVAEIAANRLAQEGLPESHPMRIFGEAVEAGGVTNAVGACEQVLGRLLPFLRKELTESLKELTESLTETLTVCIDERFAAFEKQQWPRAGPHALEDGIGKQPGTRAPVRVARVRLEGLDRVLQGVVQRCKGKELTSTLVHGLVRNLRYTLNSGKKPLAVANEVLDRLIAGGLAKDMGLKKGAIPGKTPHGRRVRVAHLKPYAAVRNLSSSDAFRRRLSLGEEDFP